MRKKRVCDLAELESIRQMLILRAGIDVKVKGRDAELVFARKVFTKIARNKKYRFKEIGAFMGKDHATVIHYKNDIDAIMSYDNKWRDEYYRLIGRGIKRLDADYFYLSIGAIN